MNTYISRKKKIIIIALCIIIFFSFFKKMFDKINSDHMEISGILDIKYRVHNSKWSKWSKNGIISGDKKSSVNSIQLQMEKGNGIVISTYRNKWSADQDNNFIPDKVSNKKPIKAIKLDAYYEISSKYELCYRTYNKKDKWLDWTCNWGISGNKKENIKAIEVKVIPKGVVKNDYLKDYGKNSFISEIGF